MIKLLFTILLLLPSVSVAETFTSTIKMKKDTSSPNIELHECNGCRDTYANVSWIGADGNHNVLLSAHEIKGSTNTEHFHFMERFSCGSDTADITSCGRIETDIDKDHPVREFRNMDLYVNKGKVFLRSPDGNKWSITVDNIGEIITTDENPQ